MGKVEPRRRGPIRDKNGVYHYRRRIPRDIRQYLEAADALPNVPGKKLDKREEKKRLGRDLVRAQAAWIEYDRQVEARWAQLRAGPAESLTIVQREALAGDIYRRWIELFPPDHPSSERDAALSLAMMQELDHEIPRSILNHDYRTDEEILECFHGDYVDAVLAKRGLILHPRARWQVILTVQSAAKHACRYAMKRCKGDLRPDPDADRYPAWPDPRTTTLVGLHELWVKNRKPNEETKRAFRASIDKFVAFLGFDDVTRLTSADIRRWCSSMKEQGDISGIRIRDGYLAAVKAVLNSAVTLGYLENNPAATVKVEVEKRQETREKDLRDSEIYVILSGTLGEFDDSVSEDVRNARRWVPWLCAYTGARVAEMTRLESRHIIREDGVDGIHIEISKTGRARIFHPAAPTSIRSKTPLPSSRLYCERPPNAPSMVFGTPSVA